MAGFPGLSANPIENGERGKLYSQITFQALDITSDVLLDFFVIIAQVTRNEDDDRFCLLLCWKNSNNWSPECRKCASDCETTSCAKTPEVLY
jgi:hypothetical protein